MDWRSIASAAVTLGILACGDSSPTPAISDPCKENNGGCASNATCNAVDGMPICACKPGYIGDGFTCTEEDAPVITIDSPAEGSTFSLVNGAAVTVSGTVKDADLQEVAYRLDEGASTKISLEGDTFSFSFDLSEEDRASHLVSIIARDVSGHSSEAKRTIVVDRLAPRISIVSPGDAAIFTADTLEAEGTIDDADLQNGTWSLDEGEQTAIVLVGNTFRFSIPLPADDNTSHRLTVSAVDGVGNPSSVDVTFVVDRVGPAITVDNLPDQTIIGKDAPNPFVVFGRYDGAAAASYQLDGASTPLPAGDAFSIPIPLDEYDDLVEHTLVIESTDSNDNSSSLTITFFVDRLAPTIVIQNLDDQDALGVAAASPFIVTGEIDDAQISQASYQLDSNDTSDLSHPSFAVPVPLDETDNYEPHYLAIEATDSAGNTTRTTRTFFVDRILPQISIADLAPAQVLGQSAPNPFVVTGTLVDPSLASASYKLDDAAPVAFAASATFSVGLPLNEADDHARHTLQLEAKDAADNIGRLSVDFFVDRVAPRLSITTPTANASCSDSAATCSGDGIINLATGSNFAFAGTVEDGGPMTSASLASTIGSEQLSPSMAGGTNWGCTWSNLPLDDGASHSFTIVATDQAGNATTVSRTVWVDRVAPRLGTTVNSARLVARDALLATFSERMDVASVKSASTFTPAVSTASFGSSDGESFGFSNASTLAPYQVYSLLVGSQARDRAGNPFSATASIKFLTEPLEPNTVSEPIIAYNADEPVLRTDSDGKPALLYHDIGSYHVRSKYWIGKSLSWADDQIGGAPGVVSEWPGDFEVSGIIQSDLQLALTYRAALKELSGSGYAVYAAEDTPTTGWSITHLGTTSSLGHPTIAWGNFDGVTKQFIAYLTADNLKLNGHTRLGSNWSATPQQLVTLTMPAIAMRDAGLLDSDAVTYIPERTKLPRTLDTSAGGVSVAGVQQAVVGSALTGTAYLAWSATATFVPPVGAAITNPLLEIACSSDPASPTSWHPHIDTPPSIVAINGSSRLITRLAMAASETKVAIAVEVDGDTVIYGSMDSGGCSSAPPNITWETEIAGAKQPSVAVGRNGKVYKVYVTESSSTLRWAD